MIRLENVSFQYSGAEEKALRNVSLCVKAGEFVVLLGRSGCGKTTLTRLMNRLVPGFYEGKLEGKVFIDGKDSDSLEIRELAGIVGSVFQDPRSQFFATDTTEEIAFSCENIGLPREVISSRIEDAVKTLQITNLMDRDIFGLSSGEKQSIAIASVYALHPKIFVLDEPSANLDNQAVENLRQVLMTLKSQGYTIVISEHRIHYLKDLADRAVIIEEGQIKEELTGDRFRCLSNAEANKMGLRSTDLSVVLPRAMHFHGTEEQICVENLSFGYGRTNVVWNHISFSARKGSIVGIIGGNGIGKTTLISVICGLKAERTGAVILSGEKLSPRTRINKTYLVMQDSDYQLFSESVEKELYLGEKPGDADKEKGTAALVEMGLSNLASRHPASLSGGQKQRLCIAVARMKDADIICFDEPTSGLDYQNMIAVSNLLLKLSQRGKTLFVVTHDYEFLMSTCTHVMNLEKGSIRDYYAVTKDSAHKVYETMFLG